MCYISKVCSIRIRIESIYLVLMSCAYVKETAPPTPRATGKGQVSFLHQVFSPTIRHFCIHTNDKPTQPHPAYAPTDSTRRGRDQLSLLTSNARNKPSVRDLPPSVADSEDDATPTWPPSPNTTTSLQPQPGRGRCPPTTSSAAPAS